MKLMKRFVAWALAICMILPVIPYNLSELFTFSPAAAPLTSDYRYELDTDGIDVGATYLVLNSKTAGNRSAMKFNYNSGTDNQPAQQSVPVQTEDGITFISAFNGDGDCQFIFTDAEQGSIRPADESKDYYLNIKTKRYQFSMGEADESYQITFTNLGGGAYSVKCGSQYLRPSSTTSATANWKSQSTLSSSKVYLFKQVSYEKAYTVTFDGNGHTAGDVPADLTLTASTGFSFTVPAPVNELRKDVDGETWFFQCWNTSADGSGTEYFPGDTFLLTENMTLYVQWIHQIKYTVSFIAYLNGEPCDVDKIAGVDKSFYVKEENGDTYIPLTRRAEGTYSTDVAENGTYLVYNKVAEGDYQEVHGHKIVVYNNSANTECIHWSVEYNAAGGTWAEGVASPNANYHNGEAVIAPEQIPVKDGYRFLGWSDGKGGVFAPGATVTSGIGTQITLTALWEETITVTVQVVLDHKAQGAVADDSEMKHEAAFTLFREENGVKLPLDEKILTEGYAYDAVSDITTYTVIYNNMPQGVYYASGVKLGYESRTTHSEEDDKDQMLRIEMAYAPQKFDLSFEVKVNVEDGEEKLLPKAVNVKVSHWDAAAGSWTTEGQDPVTVFIDENGFGSGHQTVVRETSAAEPYAYRVEVTSFILPDESIVPAQGDRVIYRPAGSGLYDAEISIAGEGMKPEGAGNLSGAYFDGEKQVGVPTVTMEIRPYTVTFEALDGTLNGKKTLVLKNQYRYPDLNDYVAEIEKQGFFFVGWTVNDALAENQAGQLLSGDVTYSASYNNGLTLTGVVSVDTTYEYQGQIVQIQSIDLPTEVLVVLQKKVGDVYNDVDSCFAKIKYDGADGEGGYQFENLPRDGSEYRIHVLTVNYVGIYDNDGDENFSAQEQTVLVETEASSAELDVRLEMVPETYSQPVAIDASHISKEFRPTKALVQIVYRDPGDAHYYNLISQHKNSPYGVEMELDAMAQGSGSESIWVRTVGANYYEYQLRLKKLYGSVEGAYIAEGTDYQHDSPYTVKYSAPATYADQATLKATLIPRQFPVFLDLNLEGDEVFEVNGLENFVYDDGTGELCYAYMHTWSYADHLEVYPEREGYVFMGWEVPEETGILVFDQGKVHVGADIAEAVTLKAIWQKLEYADYVIQYRELNTEQVLSSTQVFTETAVGTEIVAADVAQVIDGYEYVGAAIGETYLTKEENPALTVNADPMQNFLTVYYLPTDGYTDQVEENLKLNKDATLENDGTYTINMETFTVDNPITALIEQNTPLDIVLVLDQSGSLYDNEAEYLNALENAVDNFTTILANHGRENKVDHRIALVGFSGDEDDIPSNTAYPYTGQGIVENESERPTKWINTGFFDSNGVFHHYDIKGFVYSAYNGTPDLNGAYYTWNEETKEFLLLMHHDSYYHLISEDVARRELLLGNTIYGYADGGFVKLTRNTSGLWLYGDKQLYSKEEFFTYHEDVWTHRAGVGERLIHGYGVGDAYASVDGHEGLYTRTETTATSGDASYESIYKDALIPVSVGPGGSGSTNPVLLNATHNLGANGATRTRYGVEMANSIFAANPLDPDEGRLRVMVLFSDGEPGFQGFVESNSDYYQQAMDEANATIAYAWDTKNVHNAHVYTIGLYKQSAINPNGQQAIFMNAVSSNYTNVKSMDDLYAEMYKVATVGVSLNSGDAYYVYEDGAYRLLQYSNYRWVYTNASGGTSNLTASRWMDSRNLTVGTDSKINNKTIYTLGSPDSAAGYYSTTENSNYLKDYFAKVLREITTKTTIEVVLHEGTILRDIMNQGLVLTDGSKITVYTQPGAYNEQTGGVDWTLDEDGNPALTERVSLVVGDGQTSARDPETGIIIDVHNYGAANATDPESGDYAPHTVDVTGYNFSEWYINETHTNGMKMLVEITRVEARDNVEWGKATATNGKQSGMWLPESETEESQFLLAFDQPTTIFVERAYVLDYGKEFTLNSWYFDDEEGKNAEAIHLDTDIASGMNYFDSDAPTVKNGEGELKYGNVRIENGDVHYTPTTTKWDGVDSFYVFGNTWRRTVTAQDANENGNLWNKVTVIPANNVYYEDSFITAEDENGGNDTFGFNFTGTWEIVKESSADENREAPEAGEEKPYGAVHGWTDDLADDLGFSDGSAHKTSSAGASTTFTFTGTGVDVYTRTNATSGTIVAVLTGLDADGNVIPGSAQSIAMDNLAKSGDYYHIPTVSFRGLAYGTYTVRLIATEAQLSDGAVRSEYYLDGIRVYNPLGAFTTDYPDETVTNGYGLEHNAVFTEIRDILLDNSNFHADTGETGAVFIDWIREGQESGDDTAGEGVGSYEIGTFREYGPKNEVYLSAGQAIVMKVDPTNTYYVGLKSLTGAEVTANISGVDRADPQQITLSHSIDQYYRVTPVDGYIVIQNGGEGEGILSLTKLRTTSFTDPAEDGGVLKATRPEVKQMMMRFSRQINALNPVLKGDVDGNKTVDLNDVIYLLYHVNFPDRFAVSQNTDYDGSGSTDLDDVIYFLFHVNFPDRYPLM